MTTPIGDGIIVEVLCGKCEEIYILEEEEDTGDSNCPKCGEANYRWGPQLAGCLNEQADRVFLINETWSDCNLQHEYATDEKFTRLICRKCKGIDFEVLITDSYETTARCKCGMYYIVHTG